MSTAVAPLSAYVHLPWCVRKCPYCDFNSHPERADSDYRRYTNALLADLEWTATQFPVRPLLSVFFGGGTPSLCPPEEIDRVLLALKGHFGFRTNVEITLEANPGTVDAGHFAEYRAAGVNRLSIGVQSFSDDALRRLGRIHDAQAAHRAIEVARAAGFENLNIDLMHSLPAQTVGEALADLQAAMSHQPEHISWYELTLEPNTAFARHPPELPGEEICQGIEKQGRRRLMHGGYRNYEVSAWARPGLRARHNLNYWRYGDFFGLGAGAHSKLSLSDGIHRLARQRAPGRYQQGAGSEQGIASHLRLSPQDKLEEFLLNALRLSEGFTRRQFALRTGLPETALDLGLRRAQGAGLVLESRGRVCASARGRRFLNDLLACFASGAVAV